MIQAHNQSAQTQEIPKSFLKPANMCHVVQLAYQFCHHHHHYEPALPCDEGFDNDICRCNVRNHQVVYTRYIPEPRCCTPCLNIRTAWLQQAFYVKLIRLKAATIGRSHSDAELDWRFETWKKQANKELYRMILTCGHPVNHHEFAGVNIEEDEVDEGWSFPLSRENLHSQLTELNERYNRGDTNPEREYWCDRRERDSD